MCGIFGMVRGGGRPVESNVLAAMKTALHHRGPDGNGIFAEGPVGLGNTRLAVVDTAGGSQPVIDPSSGAAIVYNGELFNHLELRAELESVGWCFRTHSDTEVVLAAFCVWGEDCVLRFNGMYAFAVFDPKARRVFIARDPAGIKPLYLTETADGLAFASEAKALLPIAGRRPDWQALWGYLTYGYMAPDCSPFAGITKFPAGSLAWIDLELPAARLAVRPYWQPRFGCGAPLAEGEAVDRLDALLSQAVKHELMSDVPVGLFLSGGLDSSAVAYYAARRHGQAISSFGLAFEETTHDESNDARTVARHLGIEHKELMFSPALVREGLRRVTETMDEPFGDSTVVPLLMLSRFAREHVTVVLTGWGGDEVLAGYPTLTAHRVASLYRRLPGMLAHGLVPALVDRLPVSDKYLSFEFKARRFLRGMKLTPEQQHFLWMGYFDDAFKHALLTPDVTAQVAQQDSLAHFAGMAAGMAEPTLTDRIMHLDFRYFLHGNGLFQADRMTMAASLEARVPLLNKQMLDFALPLPAGLKMAGGTPKGLLKKALAPHLPPAILSKPKKGFGPPSGHWVRSVFGPLLDHLFSRERIEAQGILNHATVARLLAEHRELKADHGRTLWALMSLQLWYDRFILDQASPLERAA
ncbi:asparagine synthase (glutamine-hydrolyzing) [Paramagnetospirillum magneticum]|uniref:asparagine synthase (glutamine-hydrolyzing) n=1 Tax=Paramagnetospirillum magneticum (strain ATCC 700264 / AMB-1) TaxID=342108 RepID=Q2WB52_PARM1|nr:asparagine synthase (glutamine-hydrolyzing) [Paramagnetospirillum magneticum]BAE48923.1 Asparagine synthase [Paramagnetospirillum magneticum AMB-1]